MSINNREDVNKYYQFINELVNEYTEKWKIRPSNLSRYLKPGSERFNRFLERNKLKGIKGADRILRDVLEDRESMERDGVITFESFKMFESSEFKILTMRESLYKGIEKANTRMEKVLADHFDTNLSDIDIVDSDKHIFKVNDWDDNEHDVIIYSIDEIDIIKLNIIDHLYEELLKRKVDLTNNISISLSDIIDNEDFEDKMVSKFGESDLLIRTITDCLGDGWAFKAEFKDHFIWVS